MAATFGSDSNPMLVWARVRNPWWMDEIALLDRLAELRECVFEVLGGDQVLPSVTWDAPWRSPDVVSSLTHACVSGLRRIKGSDQASARRLSLLILDLQQHQAIAWFLQERLTARANNPIGDQRVSRAYQ